MKVMTSSQRGATLGWLHAKLEREDFVKAVVRLEMKNPPVRIAINPNMPELVTEVLWREPREGDQVTATPTTVEGT